MSYNNTIDTKEDLKSLPIPVLRRERTSDYITIRTPSLRATIIYLYHKMPEISSEEEIEIILRDVLGV